MRILAVLLCSVLAASAVTANSAHVRAHTATLSRMQREELLEEKFEQLHQLLDRQTPYDGIMDDLERLHEEIDAIRPGANDVVPVGEGSDIAATRDVFIQSLASEDPKPELSSSEEATLRNEASAAAAADRETKTASEHKSVGFGLKDKKFTSMVIPRDTCENFPMPVIAYGLIAYEMLPKHFPQGSKINVPTKKSGCEWKIVGRYEVTKGLTDAQSALFVSDQQKKVVIVNRATYGVKDWLTNIRVWRVKCDYKYKNGVFDGDALLQVTDEDRLKELFWNKVKKWGKKTWNKTKKVYNKVKKKVKHVVKTVKQVFGPNGRCGKIHAGFKGYWRVNRQRILADIDAGGYVKNGYQIIVAGHSLGGGVGTVAAVELREKYPNAKISVYTWGAPAVGNKKFADFYNKILPNTFRYRMKWTRAACGRKKAKSGFDLVSKLPPKFLGYHHVGKERVEKCPWSCSKACCKTPSTLTGCHSDYSTMYYNWLVGNPKDYKRFEKNPTPPAKGPEGEDVKNDPADNPSLQKEPEALPPVVEEKTKEPEDAATKQSEDAQVEQALNKDLSTATGDNANGDSKSIEDLDAEMKQLQGDVSSRLSDRRKELGIIGIDDVNGEKTPDLAEGLKKAEEQESTTTTTTQGSDPALDQRREELMNRLANAQKSIVDNGGNVNNDVVPNADIAATSTSCDAAAVSKCIEYFTANRTPFTFDFNGSATAEPDQEGSCCYQSTAAPCIKKLDHVRDLLKPGQQ